MKAIGKTYVFNSPGYNRDTIAHKTLTELKLEIRLTPSLRKYYRQVGFLGGGKRAKYPVGMLPKWITEMEATKTQLGRR